MRKTSIRLLPKFKKTPTIKADAKLHDSVFQDIAKCILILFVFTFLLQKLVVRNSSQTNLLTFYFESGSVYSFAVISFMPLILLFFTGLRTLKDTLRIVIPSLGALAVLFSYFSSYGIRGFISTLYGFVPMPIGLADWITIPNFVSCADSSGCDPFGRFHGYGLGWKLLVPFGSEVFSVLVLSGSVFYILFEISRLSNYLNFPSLVLPLLVSPSLVFSIERGNSDIFLYALVLLGLHVKIKSHMFSLVFTSFLVSMKPFFIPFILRNQPKKMILFFSSIILITVYLLSTGGPISDIKKARLSTLYSPASQIGAEQIPSFFIQLYSNHLQKTNMPWDGGIKLYYLSLGIGVILTFLISLVFARNHFLVKLSSEVTQLNEYFKNVVLVSAGIFLVSHLSGSQVTYKSWMASPVIFLMIRQLTLQSMHKNLRLVLFSSLVILGCFGVNIWILRSLGTFMLSVVCIGIFLNLYFGEHYNKTRSSVIG